LFGASVVIGLMIIDEDGCCAPPAAKLFRAAEQRNKLATFVDLHLLPQPSPELQDIDLAAISQGERSADAKEKKPAEAGFSCQWENIPIGDEPHYVLGPE
jgi:hypothetical protein